MTLQGRAARWHEERFPKAERHHVVLKTMAELGEVADAVIARDGIDSAAGKEGDGITGEAADVVIALMALIGRWSDDDLLTAIERKLSLLETPGAHKASRIM